MNLSLLKITITLFLFALNSAFAMPMKVIPLQFDAEVPEVVRNQFVQDFQFLLNIQLKQSTSLHQKIFGESNESLYANYFSQHGLRYVGLDRDDVTTVVAYVLPYFVGKKIWLTQVYLKNKSLISRLATLIHEVRHLVKDNRYWEHAICPTPFIDIDGRDIVSVFTGDKLENKDACDKSEFGSYGVTTVFLFNVGQFCTNCTEEFKDEAIKLAYDQLNRIIDPKARARIEADL